MAAGSSDLAPNRVRLKRASSESTTPVAAPAKATSGRDLDPISSSCRKSSRNSNGGVTAARTTRQKNTPRSPNHSKNSLMNPLEEFVEDGTGKTLRPGLGERMTPTAVEYSLLMNLIPDLALHTHWTGACEKEGSEVRCRKTPGRCFHPHISAWCSYPSGRASLPPSLPIRSEDTFHGRTGTQSRLHRIPLPYRLDRSTYHPAAPRTCMEGVHI